MANKQQAYGYCYQRSRRSGERLQRALRLPDLTNVARPSRTSALWTNSAVGGCRAALFLQFRRPIRQQSNGCGFGTIAGEHSEMLAI